MWFQEEVDRKDRAVNFIPDPSLVEKERGAIARLAKLAFDARYLAPILTRSPYVAIDKLTMRRRPFPLVSATDLASCWKGSLAQDQIASSFARSSLNLGFTYFSGTPGTSSEIRQCRLREFEGPLYSVNGAYLMQRFPEIDDLYERDDEVIAWDTFEELTSKIKDLLANESACRQIGAKGRQAVLARHLWSHRLLDIMSHLKL
jgi:hypothetical protein